MPVEKETHLVPLHDSTDQLQSGSSCGRRIIFPSRKAGHHLGAATQAFLPVSLDLGETLLLQ